MSNPPLSEEALANAGREEIMSALFAQMVLQQSNMALMLLGRIPPPEGGQPMQDVEAAKFFIDQLEMLEVKTKGNLTKDEEKLLKQNLTLLRMAFVETIETPTPQPAGPAPAQPEAQPSPGAEASAETPPAAETATSEESRKKFTKKY